MDICPTKAEMRRTAARLKGDGATLGLVPTMGFLHDGHLALVARARELCGRVVASLFVNPAQFGPNEDFASYPRDTGRDLALFEAAGVDAVFMPSTEEMYHPDRQTVVVPVRLERALMGRLRPGHFRGVATVVAKLFNIVGPDVAVFGEKDYQQLAVIRAMVRDLDMPVRIEGVPTRREADGLAMSSRNVRLTPEDRAAAPVIARTLAAAEGWAAEGVSARLLRNRVAETIAAEKRAAVQSVDLRDALTLAPLRGRLERPAVILVAARFGPVLLIDQCVVGPAKKETP